MAAVHVTDQSFAAEVEKSDLPVLVDFFATWCGPCQMATPVLDELADEYRGKIKVVKIDVDQNSETASRYNVMSIPTVVLFQNGQEVKRQVGFTGKDGYLQMVREG